MDQNPSASEPSRNNSDESKKEEPLPWNKVRHEWTSWSILAWAAGCAVTYIVSVITTDPAWFALMTFASVAIGGIGLLLQSSAHQGSSRTEGWGKVLAVFGWSAGLLSQATSVLAGQDTPEWAYLFAPLLIIIPAVVGLTIWIFINEGCCLVACMIATFVFGFVFAAMSIGDPEQVYSPESSVSGAVSFTAIVAFSYILPAIFKVGYENFKQRKNSKSNFQNTGE